MSESSPNRPLTYQIALTSNILQRAMHRRFRENGIDITPQQMAVLSLLAEHSDCLSMHLISDKTFRDNSAVTRIVDNLEKAHYVKRHSLPGDRRVKLICISEEGRKVFGKANQIARQHVEQAVQNISEKDLSIAINVMEKIQENITPKLKKLD